MIYFVLLMDIHSNLFDQLVILNGTIFKPSQVQIGEVIVKTIAGNTDMSVSLC